MSKEGNGAQCEGSIQGGGRDMDTRHVVNRTNTFTSNQMRSERCEGAEDGRERADEQRTGSEDRRCAGSVRVRARARALA